MTRTLHLAKGLDLPLDAVTQKFAFMARSGAGKTYSATKLAEEMLGVGAQIVVVDPVGVWFGLRIGADGGEGFPIPIFGGERGDVPLAPDAGELVADLVVDRRTSVVLDVSSFTGGETRRFLTAFGERLFHRKKTARSPMHLFLEEAQVVVPQRTAAGEERLLGAYEKLVKLGRNYGIGITLISQRPQSVHKDVLNQTEALFVGQVTASHERKAIEDWIVDVAGGDRSIVKELPHLPIGTMYLWSPQWLRRGPEKVQIAKKRTGDVSATPTMGGDAIEAKPLAALDLDELRGAFAAAIEDQTANDPAALKKRIAELEKRLAEKPKTERIEVPVPVLSVEQLHVLQSVAETLRTAAGEAALAAAKVGAPLERITRETGIGHRDLKPGNLPISAQASASSPEKPSAAAPKASPISAHSSPTSLGKGERAVLTAIAQHREGVSREQLTVLTGYTRSSRNTYIQRLKAAGLVEGDETLTATSTGIAELGPGFAPLPTGGALQKYWLDRLTGGERVILSALCQRHPQPVTRDDLSKFTDYTRSSRNTYLQRLGARKLVREVRGGIVASEQLFDGASR